MILKCHFYICDKPNWKKQGIRENVTWHAKMSQTPFFLNTRKADFNWSLEATSQMLVACASDNKGWGLFISQMICPSLLLQEVSIAIRNIKFMMWDKSSFILWTCTIDGLYKLSLFQHAHSFKVEVHSRRLETGSTSQNKNITCEYDVFTKTISRWYPTPSFKDLTCV